MRISDWSSDVCSSDLFSEPGAGSDLAGIKTRGRIEGDELIVNGSKIWTSFAHVADWQELVLRTEDGSRRHAGLSWVICDMHAPGITVRPIRKMSGQTEFAEVFYEIGRASCRERVCQDV